MLSLKSRKGPMGKTVSLRKCLLLLFLWLKCSGNWWCKTSKTDSAETSRQGNHQTRANVSRGDLTKFRPTVEVRWILQYSMSPQTGNMAAVTNKESHMPLFSFMFKYKHRLESISARYFQLSHVNFYLLTFMALQLDWCLPFFIFRTQMYFRGGDGGDDHNHFIQLLCKCFRFL